VTDEMRDGQTDTQLQLIPGASYCRARKNDWKKMRQFTLVSCPLCNEDGRAQSKL